MMTVRTEEVGGEKGRSEERGGVDSGRRGRETRRREKMGVLMERDERGAGGSEEAGKG